MSGIQFLVKKSTPSPEEWLFPECRFRVCHFLTILTILTKKTPVCVTNPGVLWSSDMRVVATSHHMRPVEMVIWTGFSPKFGVDFKHMKKIMKWFFLFKKRKLFGPKILNIWWEIKSGSVIRICRVFNFWSKKMFLVQRNDFFRNADSGFVIF